MHQASRRKRTTGAWKEWREGRRKEGKVESPIQHVESLAYWTPKWFARFFSLSLSKSPETVSSSETFLSQKEAILLIGSWKNRTYFRAYIYIYIVKQLCKLRNQRCEGRNLTLGWGTSQFWTTREHFQVVCFFSLFFFFEQTNLKWKERVLNYSVK